MKNIVIRNASQTPIYQQLFDQISAQIIHGDLKPDELLPSIRMAAKALSISVITIKKTWELLENDGFIYTIKGKGSYVKSHSKTDLNKKRKAAVKQILKDSLMNVQEYHLSKTELLEIVESIYDDIKDEAS